MKDFAQSASASQKHICLVGTGSIAHVHAEAIKNIPTLVLNAVVDTDKDKARQFAKRWGVERVYTSIEEALEGRNFDRAHVAVPPDAHAVVTSRLLKALIPTLVEKPLASTSAEATRLVERAARLRTPLGVNQNAIFHPAFRKLVQYLSEGDIGRLEHVDSVYNMPLWQLTARQFSHWMFAEPKNILLEQAVHPLSQILVLVGSPLQVEASAGKPTEIAPGVTLYSACSVMLRSEHIPVLLRFAVGASYPIWQIRALGTDGLVTADMISNRVLVSGRSRWLESVDDLVSGFSMARQIAGQSIANAISYGASVSGINSRTDPFFRSMASSIEAFHNACDLKGTTPSDGELGRSLVTLSEQIATAFEQPVANPAPRRTSRPSNRHDIAILGGTGFIGRAVVARLLEKRPDLRIGVMARNIMNLPEVFYHDRVHLISGDVTSDEDASNAIDSAHTVINLAHGGGGESWSEIERRMVGSARTVAAICLTQRTKSLIHVSSIAALYLGNRSDVIAGGTPVDHRARKRAAYARAKAMAEMLLADLHGTRGLPVCILRPGIVVGEGASPFHSGLGFFNNDQHCMGWNRGRNPLPFVLVEDVADAIALAAFKLDLSGRTLNLVGDVGLTAREYIDELALTIGRPLRFHGQSPEKLYILEWGKWMVKRLAGRKEAVPSYRDFRSRGCLSTFDCSDAKAALDWTPVSDRKVLIDKAIRVHAARSQCLPRLD